LLRTKITHPKLKYLDYAYFDQIKETSKEKKDLAMKRNNLEEQQIRLLIKEELENIEKENIMDAKGAPITTGKLVKTLDDSRAGKVEGLTIDLKVRIKWLRPIEMRGKEEVVDPSEIYIY